MSNMQETHVFDNTHQERKRESVRKWYSTHRELYAQLRKERYASDPKRRAKARKAARMHRAKLKKGHTAGRVLTRTLNGDAVQVYTTGYIAEKYGVPSHLIRLWEARNLIPETLFEEDKHRLYTSAQVKLIAKLAKKLEKFSKKQDDPAFVKFKKTLFADWEG